MPRKRSTIALMYDFDKTLCNKDMQEYTFIPKLGMTATEFWQEASILSKENKMDGVLAYMYLMLDKAHLSRIRIQREEFVKLGKDLEFYAGVITWFDRIKKIGDELGINVEHYIISSGLREIIEGSSIFKQFKEVFACEFLYDENGVACWPKNAVNYTTKTQFLFRINKGVLDISNDEDLNKYKKEEQRPIPFRNMIYIGDGLTDVPCMKLVKVNGGHSIAVYVKKKKVESLLKDQRVDFIAPADYSEGKELECIVKRVMTKMANVDLLQQITKKQLKAIG